MHWAWWAVSPLQLRDTYIMQFNTSFWKAEESAVGSKPMILISWVMKEKRWVRRGGCVWCMHMYLVMTPLAIKYSCKSRAKLYPVMSFTAMSISSDSLPSSLSLTHPPTQRMQWRWGCDELCVDYKTMGHAHSCGKRHCAHRIYLLHIRGTENMQ